MFRRFLATLLIPVAAFFFVVRADDQDSKSQPKPKSPPDAAIDQQRLADQFRAFETALLHLAQRLERSSKPEDRERAAILKEAIKKSSEQNIDMKFKSLVDLLQSSKAFNLNEIKEAMDRSKVLADDIRAVLALLMSDNRDAWLKGELARLRQFAERLDKIIREEKLVRAQTESAQAEKGALKKAQEKVTKSTEDLAKAMGKDKDSESKQGKSSEKGKGKGEEKGQNKKNGEGKGKSSPSGESQKQSGQETPGKPQVEQAVKKQKQSEGDLEKGKTKDASNAQDEAIKKLEEARKRLEEILRQLREEEMERLLARLQARCERMLAMQIEVYDGTVRVDKAIGQNPDKKAGRTEEQSALQLSDREQEIVREANKAIQLLQDEGTAVAFPEVFTQVRDDTQQIARRLGKADVASVTQTIEQDVIATLKEMIEALKKAAQQAQNSRSEGRPGNANSNQRLIDILAELKMIRSLQVRVNNRTVAYARRYPGEQANDSDIQKELANLAQRQQKIFEVTNNIARGKNR
jgi:hypothetical protein